MTILETERLILRKFTIADTEDSYLMNTDPEVVRYTGSEMVESRKQMASIIRNTTLADYAKYGYGRLAVIYKPDNAFVGFAGLKYLPEYDEVDLGYRLLKKYWGIGIATEASRPIIEYGFNELKLDKIIGFVMPPNTGSKNVLLKLGFSSTGLELYDGLEVEKYVLKKKLLG